MQNLMLQNTNDSLWYSIFYQKMQEYIHDYIGLQNELKKFELINCLEFG